MDAISQKLAQFFTAYPSVSYPKRSIIIKGGEEPKGVMYIESGYIRQYILSRNGEEQSTMIYGPSDLFPLTWTITQRETSHRFFESLTTVTLRYSPRNDYIAFVQQESAVSYFVMQQILSRFDNLLERMAYISLSSKAQTKILVLLLMLCQRFGTDCEHNKLSFSLTHKDIASFLGITRETVSIALKKLIDAGIIVHKEHLLWIGKKDVLRHDPVLHDLVDG